MYLDALSFLEDEREGYRAYEALSDLTDEQLETPVEGAHGWSGRDLMGHILFWQVSALDSARELAVNETSPTLDRLDAEWNASPDAGERINEEALARYREMPLDELRRQFANVSGELRGYLTVVPESRWIKHARHQEWFFGEMTEHYDDHMADLRAILAAAGR
jgi:hypothetical protein